MCTPVGPAEVAEILGVSGKRVYQLRGKQDFPKVRWNLAYGPLWERSEIEEYARKPRPSGWPAGKPRRSEEELAHTG